MGVDAIFQIGLRPVLAHGISSLLSLGYTFLLSQNVAPYIHARGTLFVSSLRLALPPDTCVRHYTRLLSAASPASL